jgi:hypothetical protein
VCVCTSVFSLHYILCSHCQGVAFILSVVSCQLSVTVYNVFCVSLGLACRNVVALLFVASFSLYLSQSAENLNAVQNIWGEI